MNRLFKNSYLLPMLLAAAAAISVTGGPAQSAGFVRSGNKVTCGGARFDVLSATVIRMQYSPGAFVDVPTAVVTNRSMADNAFTVSAKSGTLEIKTPRMSVFYTLGSGKFTPKNLRIIWKDGQGRQEWNSGRKDTQNLGGPFKSFNSVIEGTEDGHTLPPFPDGPLSRAGYFMLDDSATPVCDKKTEWIKARASKDSQDWYFFAYGTNYKDFYKQYIELLGKIPMIPRYTFGAWVTDLNFEYLGQKHTYTGLTYNENYVYDIVDRFRKEQIPLDVFVLDFGWHKYGWGGSLDWSR